MPKMNNENAENAQKQASGAISLFKNGNESK